MMKAICLLSGGMDSSTLAYLARDMGFDLYALHFNYGQRTESRERLAAATIAGLLNAEEFLEVDLEYLSRIGTSSLTDHSMVVDRFVEGDRIPNTYVPFRNANLLAIATSFAEARGAEAIFIGVQSQDYSGYPDCRPGFIEAFQKAVDMGTRDDTHITIRAPFINMNKSDIIRKGLELGVPYRHTWSCYRNEERACGECGACHYRREAFSRLGLRDPIQYEKE
ncbi:MAG TPA: 7-cyano-7-deazaguanine synthase QueC [Methanolinea sp.]|nr:7-cyano-7-deazaguanine synthase QueC [Methanolinea sp.]